MCIYALRPSHSCFINTPPPNPPTTTDPNRSNNKTSCSCSVRSKRALSLLVGVRVFPVRHSQWRWEKKRSPISFLCSNAHMCFLWYIRVRTGVLCLSNGKRVVSSEYVVVSDWWLVFFCFQTRCNKLILYLSLSQYLSVCIMFGLKRVIIVVVSGTHHESAFYFVIFTSPFFKQNRSLNPNEYSLCSARFEGDALDRRYCVRLCEQCGRHP